MFYLNVRNLISTGRNGKNWMKKMTFTIFYRSKEWRDKEAGILLRILMILN